MKCSQRLDRRASRCAWWHVGRRGAAARDRSVGCAATAAPGELAHRPRHCAARGRWQPVRQSSHRAPPTAPPSTCEGDSTVPWRPRLIAALSVSHGDRRMRGKQSSTAHLTPRDRHPFQTRKRLPRKLGQAVWPSGKGRRRGDARRHPVERGGTTVLTNRCRALRRLRAAVAWRASVRLVAEGLLNRLRRKEFMIMEHTKELLSFAVVSRSAGTHWQLEPLRRSSV